MVALYGFIAEEVRLYLAAMGARSVDEIVGRVDLLSTVESSRLPQVHRLSLSRVLRDIDPDKPRAKRWGRRRNETRPQMGSLDDAILEECRPALDAGTDVEVELNATVQDLSIGARLAGEIGRRRLTGQTEFGAINATIRGSSGQSFGVFCTAPMCLTMVGEAQDGVGKSMSGGRLVLRPRARRGFEPHGAVIAGNAVLYGANGGEAFIAGTRRRAVRGAEQRCDGGRRGVRRPRLRVHDRRAGGAAGRHRAELRGGHDRGRGVGAR